MIMRIKEVDIPEDTYQEEEELQDIDMETNPFKMQGLINRRYHLFTRAIISIVTSLSILIIYVATQDASLLSSVGSLLLLASYALIYIATYKRTADIRGHNIKRKLWFEALIYCFPLVCIIPIFTKGKISPKLQIEENKKVKNRFWALEGRIKTKYFILNLAISAVLIMVGCFLTVMINLAALKDPVLAPYFTKADAGFPMMAGLMIFGFNIAKYVRQIKHIKSERAKAIN